MSQNPHPEGHNNGNEIKDLNNNDDDDSVEMDSSNTSESSMENTTSSYESSDEELEIVQDLHFSRAPQKRQPVIHFEQLKNGDKVFAPETLKGIDRPWHAANVGDVSERYKKFVVTVIFSTALIKGFARILNQKVAKLSLKHVAYFDEKPTMCKMIPKGVRVVALTTFQKSLGSRFYSGIVAEIPKTMNNDRYLIIFDTGAVKYILKENVRMICLQESNPWSDMHRKVQMFVKNFLEISPDYPLARRTRLFSIIQVEWNGFWWSARVIQVDCSLIQVELIENYLQFWLYRGSERILENNEKAQRKIKKYKSKVESGQKPEPLDYCEEFEGKVEKHQVPSKYLNQLGIQNTFHVCSPKTCSFEDMNILPKNVSPLCRPFYFRWDRRIENNGEQDVVYYITPCGRKMCSMKKIDEFLKTTKSSLGIDAFCFDIGIDCLAVFKPRLQPFIIEQDISNGLEKVAVERINAVDKCSPPNFVYVPNNVEDESVKIRKDDDQAFLMGCDCEDNCADKKNCSCCKLTRENGSRIIDGVRQFGPEVQEFGYEDKRLFDEYVSGIYECNPNCKCSASCHNRVVQHGLQYSLQIFKTSKKGYAVRTMQDIPNGAFICIYAGELMSHEVAFSAGMQDGDDYLFDVDMIENFYSKKPGYEPNVIEPEQDKKKDNSKKKLQNGNSNKLALDEKEDDNSDDDDENQSEMTERMKMFGPEEEIFLVDSMRVGNIGRFLSHSCDPNVWAQNVFVNTHDLRFPVAALWTNKTVKCGTELTWNYNYQVGSVEGKEIICNCGAAICKRRLL